MAYGRIYTASFTGVAVTAQQDIFDLLCPAGIMAEVLEVCLSQTTEIGDAQEEGLSILVKQGATVTGSGGTLLTPIPLMLGDAAATTTVRANDTTPAGTGTIVTQESWSWNVRVPYQRIWLPDQCPLVKISTRLVIGLATTPADSITMSGYIKYKEIG